ncbi:MAG: hypothetical protein IJ881_05835 [Neisseriaceae bacterium]|nr:hypothetical protein [Neisseriaceae bacterium]
MRVRKKTGHSFGVFYAQKNATYFSGSLKGIKNELHLFGLYDSKSKRLLTRTYE